MLKKKENISVLLASCADESVSFKLDMIIITTKALCCCVLVCVSLTFMCGQKFMRKPKQLGLLSCKFFINQDDIRYAFSTFWFDGYHYHSVLHKFLCIC